MNLKIKLLFTTSLLLLNPNFTFAHDKNNQNETVTYENEKVIVTGKRREVIRNVDSNIYKIKEKSGNTTANVQDVLSILPSIYIDTYGNIKVQDEYAQIYVGDNIVPTDSAKNISAGSVESIEVITNPSGSNSYAKIKIKLKKSKKDKKNANGNINIYGETIGAYGADYALNYFKDKLTVNAQLNASHFFYFADDNFLYKNKIFKNNQLTNENELKTIRAPKKTYFTSFNNLIYQYKDKKSLNLIVALEGYYQNGKINGESIWKNYPNTNIIDSYNYNKNYKKNNFTYSYGIINKAGDENDKGLNTSLIYIQNYFENNKIDTLKFDSITNNVLDNLQDKQHTKENTYSLGQYFERTRGHNNIDIKFVIQKKQSNIENIGYSNTATYDDNFYTDSIAYDLDINQKFKVKNIDFKIGADFTKYNYKFRNNINSLWSKGETNGVYPIILIKQNLTKYITIKSSASHKSTDFDLRQLDPSIIKTGIDSITYGNPNLKPGEYNHYNLEFDYDKGTTNTSITFWLKERKKDVTTITTFNNNNNIYETTFLNIGKQNKYAIEYSYRKELKNLTCGIDFSKYFTKIETPLNDKYAILDYQTHDAKIIFEYKNKRNDTLLVNFSFHGPRYGLNNKTSGYNNVNMKLTHEFKNNLVLSSEVDLKLSHDISTTYYKSESYQQSSFSQNAYNNLKLTLAKKF